jgi:hypothetical protein
VRVAPHARSAYIADLLRHLERVGFDGVPRWLGRTDDGYELLTYIEGYVPPDPPYNLDDDQLIAAGDLVRRFHDAVAGTPLCGGKETVCHDDLGPHNTVFRDGRPVAIIDWDDDVGPGLRAVDFADAVWGFAELTSDSVPVAEQARRNHLAAGRTGPLAVFEGLIAWMDRHGSTIAADR